MSSPFVPSGWGDGRSGNVRRPNGRSTSPASAAALHPFAVDARRELHQHHLSVHWRGAAARRLSMEMAGRSPWKSDSHGRGSPGANAGFDVAARHFAPNYRFSNPQRALPHSVGTRRGVSAPAQHFYRGSFMDELADAAGRPYLYRRELILRTNLPYKADMIKALDSAAQMSGWGYASAARHSAGHRVGRTGSRAGAAMRPLVLKSIPFRSASKAKCV